MSTAVARTWIRQGAVDAMPASVAGTRSIIARSMIRAIHGAKTHRRNPFLVAIKTSPSRVTDASLVDARTVSGAVTITLLGSPIDRAIRSCKAYVTHAGTVVGDTEWVEDEGA